MVLDPFAYYSPETYLFTDLQKRFAETGELDPEALYRKSMPHSKSQAIQRAQAIFS